MMNSNAIDTNALRAWFDAGRKLLDAPAELEQGEDASLLEKVRRRLARHPQPEGGVKATVDMSPELSKRAKLYALDHGNLAVRVVFIELLDAFLQEEGY